MKEHFLAEALMVFLLAMSSRQFALCGKATPTGKINIFPILEFRNKTFDILYFSVLFGQVVVKCLSLSLTGKVNSFRTFFIVLFCFDKFAVKCLLLYLTGKVDSFRFVRNDAVLISLLKCSYNFLYVQKKSLINQKWTFI